MKPELKRRRWKKVLLGTVCLALLIGLAAFVVVSLGIGKDVRTMSSLAQQRYGGDAVRALSACVEDPALSLRERNRAVWALGQLGDGRALPVLRKHHTGQPCHHAQTLCQRELGKAIRLVDGGINVSAWIWRGRSLQ